MSRGVYFQNTHHTKEQGWICYLTPHEQGWIFWPMQHWPHERAGWIFCITQNLTVYLPVWDYPSASSNWKCSKQLFQKIDWWFWPTQGWPWVVTATACHVISALYLLKPWPVTTPPLLCSCSWRQVQSKRNVIKCERIYEVDQIIDWI